MRGFEDGSLDPQGPAARAIADLWWLMFWIGLGIFVVVVALLVVGLVRRGSSDERSGDDEPGRIRSWVIGGGVVMPTIVLIVIFGATVQAMRQVPSEAPDDALAVQIIGHQWWWEVHYPDAGVTTRNELHMPVGRPVEFQLTSADVIHSFWVPALGGKRDLLPEDVTTVVYTADEPGEHLTQCAEFCGLEHAEMFLTVVAEPEEDFAAWIDAQRGSG